MTYISWSTDFAFYHCHWLKLFLYIKKWRRPGVFVPLRALALVILHTSANFEKSKTIFLKQIIFLKSINTLLKMCWISNSYPEWWNFQLVPKNHYRSLFLHTHWWNFQLVPKKHYGFLFLHTLPSTVSFKLKYHIRPNYRTVRLTFSNWLEVLVSKSHHNKRTSERVLNLDFIGAFSNWKIGL